MIGDNRKLFIIFGGLAVFVVLLVVGVNTALKLIPAPKIQSGGTAPIKNNGTIRIEAPDGNKNTKVNILDQSPPDPRAITYTENGFSVQNVTVSINDSIGCLITIINNTALPLHVGVGPHNPSGNDPGANYGDITPGESGILDPRYTGLAGITLHNHAKPVNELTVTYGEGCK